MDDIDPHENHEILNSDCPDCMLELNSLIVEFGRPPKRMSSKELMEMFSDRELMKDEFHT